MPHISVKMYKGHSEEKKQLLTDEIVRVFGDVLGSPENVVSVSIEDIEPADWDKVYDCEIKDNKNLYKAPNYENK